MSLPCTIENVCFIFGGEIPGQEYECEISAEYEQTQYVPLPDLYNEKPYFVALDLGCTTQTEDYYIWWCTQGANADSWVYGPLGELDPANIHSVLTNSSNDVYPIGTWELGGSGSLANLVIESKFCEKPCCRTVIASVETYLKYAEAVGLTTTQPVP